VRLLVVLFLCARPALADMPSPSPEPEAKQHYLSGAAAYDRGDYQLAVDEFRRAWHLSHQPAMLFNLGRAESKLGHDETALQYLREYLEELPDSPDVPAVRSEIEAREKALAEKRALDQVVASTAARDRAAADAARARKRRTLRIGGWTLFVAGLAIVAGGIGAGAVAAHDQSTVQSSGATSPGGAPVPFSRVSAAANEGPVAANVGASFDVFGGIVAAVGAGLAGWSYKF